MIPVAPAPEPPSFDAKVRQPGLDAMNELIGKRANRRRSSRPRAKVASRRDQIPPDQFPPLWREKNDLDLVLDPFQMETGLFALEFVEFQVEPAPTVRGAKLQAVLETIDVLGLNRQDCRTARAEYVENYRTGPGHGGIDLAYLERRAPFVAQELRRQGLLVRGDV